MAQVTLPTGKRKTKYGKTQKEVKVWLQEQREAVSKGTYVENDQVTLSAFLEEYMTAASNNLRPKTVNSYLYLIRKHITPELGSVKLSQLSATQLQSFYNAKVASGLSKRTVQYMHAVLHNDLSPIKRTQKVSK